MEEARMQIFAEAHLNARMQFLPAPQYRREDPGGGRRNRRELELPRLEAQGHARRPPGAACVANRRSRLWKEALTRHREAHSSRPSFQEHSAHLPLQPT